jgi:hypothetical protein
MWLYQFLPNFTSIIDITNIIVVVVVYTDSVYHFASTAHQSKYTFNFQLVLVAEKEHAISIIPHQRVRQADKAMTEPKNNFLLFL